MVPCENGNELKVCSSNLIAFLIKNTIIDYTDLNLYFVKYTSIQKHIFWVHGEYLEFL